MKITRKAIKVGNSVAVTLPEEFMKSNRIKPGDAMELDVHGDMMYVSSKKSTSPKLTPEFKLWLDDFSQKYKQTIIELAHLP